MCMCSHRRGGASGSRTRVPSLLHEQPSLYQRGHFHCVLLSHLIFSQRCLKGIHLRALWTKNLPEGYRMRSAKKLMTPATAFQNSQGTARKIYHFPEWNYIFPYSQCARKQWNPWYLMRLHRFISKLPLRCCSFSAKVVLNILEFGSTWNSSRISSKWHLFCFTNRKRFEILKAVIRLDISEII